MTFELPREITPAALDRITSLNFPTFLHRTFQVVAPGDRYSHAWYLDLLCDRLMMCLHRDIRRLIICLPPRHLKSVAASVAFPAFVLGHRPETRIICASYSAELAGKLARDTRAVMESGWYGRAFPATRLSKRRSAEMDFNTTHGGYRMATSVGGTLTGRGANFIIVDDPLKAEDAMSESHRATARQWLTNTLLSRLDDKHNDVIIVVTQRLHPDDLVGFLLETPGDWDYLALPAIATCDENFVLSGGSHVGRSEGEVLNPARETLETLETIRRQMGSPQFSAQYQQDPLPPEGNMIRWDWFQVYDTPLERQESGIIIQSWDTASKATEISDWSVCTTWLQRDQKFYLLDVWRDRLEYPYLKKKIIELAREHGADEILIEDKASGTQLIQDLRESGVLYPIEVSPESDKITRMSAQSRKIEAGRVYIPRTAPWLDTFRAEVLQFPRGRHDDQVDSLSQVLGHEARRESWRPEDVPNPIPLKSNNPPWFNANYPAPWDM